MIRYDTIWYETIQYNTLQHNAVQCNAIQCNTIQYNTIQYTRFRHWHYFKRSSGLCLLLEKWRLINFNVGGYLIKFLESCRGLCPQVTNAVTRIHSPCNQKRGLIKYSILAFRIFWLTKVLPHLPTWKYRNTILPECAARFFWRTQSACLHPHDQIPLPGSNNRLLPNRILKSRSRETIPSACKDERQLSFLRLISIKSPVLSKRLIACGKCKTPIRGRGRQFNRIDSISGKVNLLKLDSPIS